MKKTRLRPIASAILLMLALPAIAQGFHASISSRLFLPLGPTAGSEGGGQQLFLTSYGPEASLAYRPVESLDLRCSVGTLKLDPAAAMQSVDIVSLLAGATGRLALGGGLWGLLTCEAGLYSASYKQGSGYNFAFDAGLGVEKAVAPTFAVFAKALFAEYLALETPLLYSVQLSAGFDLAL
jgi:hypothetical protein